MKRKLEIPVVRYPRLSEQSLVELNELYQYLKNNKKDFDVVTNIKQMIEDYEENADKISFLYLEEDKELIEQFIVFYLERYGKIVSGSKVVDIKPKLL